MDDPKLNRRTADSIHEMRGEPQTTRHVFISVVIPVYRAEQTLLALCRRLCQTLAGLPGEHEVILIDDRSPDRSWEVIQQMVQTFPIITAARLSRNFGQHSAITAGLNLSRGDWTVIMDCDLQDLPEEIPGLLAKALEGYDIVLARRELRQDALWKRTTSRLFYRVFNLLSGYQVDASVGAFRILRKAVVEAYCSMPESARLFGGMIQWLGFHTGFVDVEHAPRQEGHSSYSLRALVRLALDGIVAFSNRPLYFSISMGVAIAFVSGAYGAYVIVRFLFHPQVGVPGWPSLIAVSAFIGGLILLNLGILGIYVGRIYDQTKGRPLYVIDRMVAHVNEHDIHS